MDASWIAAVAVGGVELSEGGRSAADVGRVVRHLTFLAGGSSGSDADPAALAARAVQARGLEWQDAWITQAGGVSPDGAAQVSRVLRLTTDVIPSILRLAEAGAFELTDEAAVLVRLASFLDVHVAAQSQSDRAAVANAIADGIVRPGLRANAEEFVLDGVPTVAFYEEVHAHLSTRAERGTGPGPASAVAGDSVEGDPEADDDDFSDDDFAAVSADVSALPLSQIFAWVRSGVLDLNPSWQRGVVWSKSRQKKLIESIILGIPIPSVILHVRKARIEVIDGKQRLTSIVEFMKNEWALPNYDEVPGAGPLRGASRRYYDLYDPDKPKKLRLSDELRVAFELYKLPILLFKDVSDRRLRRIFNLYNTNATQLNQAEIRNAVYQSHGIHRMLFALAEREQVVDPLMVFLPSVGAQREFTARLRQARSRTARYATLDFLCRYLGYSRAIESGSRRSGATFGASSTSSAVNRYFDSPMSRDEDPRAVAAEIVQSFDDAEAWFEGAGDDGPHAFHKVEGDRVKFNGLVATTSMVVARMLRDLIRRGLITEERARAAALRGALTVNYPDGQTSQTIWAYQARVVVTSLNELGLLNAGTLPDEWQSFARKMDAVLDPSV